MSAHAKAVGFVAEALVRKATLIAEADGLRREQQENEAARAASVRLDAVDVSRPDHLRRVMAALRRIVEIEEGHEDIANRWREWHTRVDAFERWAGAQAKAVDDACVETGAHLDPKAFERACENAERRES